MVLLILKFQLKEFIRRINIFSNRLKNFRNDAEVLVATKVNSKFVSIM